LPWVLGALINSHLAAYSLWFVIGMVSCLHLPQLKGFLQRAGSVLPAVLTLTVAGAFVEWELIRQASGRMWIAGGVTTGDNLLALGVLLAIMTREDSWLPRSLWLERVGERSFGVYLVHVFALEVAARGTYHVAPALLAYTMPFWLLLVVSGIAVPLLVMKVVERSPFRRYYPYAFG
jgi:peptidoglycan/LPS O-acetylase OafA/YrhL